MRSALQAIARHHPETRHLQGKTFRRSPLPGVFPADRPEQGRTARLPSSLRPRATQQEDLENAKQLQKRPDRFAQLGETEVLKKVVGVFVLTLAIRN
ncbi:MAG: hypothetical protein MZU97_13490 [Bacillus subtilis]|nr:hypothetical protein [Bacillus subtilis]